MAHVSGTKRQETVWQEKVIKKNDYQSKKDKAERTQNPQLSLE